MPERYQKLIEVTRMGFHILDHQGRVVDANAQYIRMTGHQSLSEISGRAVLEWTAPHAVKENVDAIARCIDDGYIHGWQTEYVDRTGRTTPVEINAAVDGHGEALRIFCVSQDITAHRSAEAALRESEIKYQELYDEAPVGYHEIDRDGRIVQVNKTEAVMLGYAPEEMIGKYIWEFLPKDQRELSRKAVRRKIRQKQAEHGFERKYLCKDGSAIDVFITDRLHLDPKGRVIGMRSTIQDITEHKRAETALRESEARFRGAFEASYIGMALVALEGRLLEVNRSLCKMLGYKERELLTKTFHDITHPDDLEADVANVRRLIEGESSTYHMEKRYIHKTGRTVWALLSVFLVRGDGNKPLYFVSQVEDVTSRKKAEAEREKMRAQLVQAQKMELVGRLAGGIAHDFNNMLCVIIGHAEMAMQGIGADHPLFADITAIRNAAEFSANITQQLLGFARKQTIAPEMLDLNKTVEGMFEMLRRLIGENIELAWMPCKDLKPIKMDPSQLSQILVNLCVNARDAISGVGKITIETGTAVIRENSCRDQAEFLPGRYVKLTVSDNGCGMDKKTLANIFDPFYTTKPSGKGAGLGLATVYGIVRQNNGFINAYSEPGQGTRFSIYLRGVAGPLQKHKPADLEKQAAGGKETILLVEDEPVILTMTTSMLKRRGYTVLAASSPGEAIRLAESHAGRLHLLITDVVLPEMNGRELSEKILADHPDMKTLFVSGYTANAIVNHGVLKPDVHFMQKPFSIKQFTAKVREALDN